MMFFFIISHHLRPHDKKKAATKMPHGKTPLDYAKTTNFSCNLPDSEITKPSHGLIFTAFQKPE
jgi:hypothetical protein